MSKDEAKQMLEDISVLFESGDPPEALLVSCYQGVEKYPTESDFWCLSSRILQSLNRPEDARKDINEALRTQTHNIGYNLQLFKVLIQQQQTEMIPRRINWLFENADKEVKRELAKFAEVALGTGMFSKLELVDSVLVEILKTRNSKTDQ